MSAGCFHVCGNPPCGALRQSPLCIRLPPVLARSFQVVAGPTVSTTSGTSTRWRSAGWLRGGRTEPGWELQRQMSRRQEQRRPRAAQQKGSRRRCRQCSAACGPSSPRRCARFASTFGQMAQLVATSLSDLSGKVDDHDGKLYDHSVRINSLALRWRRCRRSRPRRETGHSCRGIRYGGAVRDGALGS